MAANSSGQIVIGFTNITNNALINAIEVNAAGGYTGYADPRRTNAARGY